MELYPEGKYQFTLRGIKLLEVMAKRVEAESGNGELKVCYLIVSNDSFVDKTAQFFDFLRGQNYDAENGVPADGLTELSNPQRSKILTYLSDQEARNPDFCSISGFRIEQKALDPVFSNYNRHLTEDFENLEGQARKEEAAKNANTKVPGFIQGETQKPEISNPDFEDDFEGLEDPETLDREKKLSKLQEMEQALAERKSKIKLKRMGGAPVLR